MAKPPVRLKDIAEATGFSANTVSLALRGSPRLPVETRERVLEVAERLNYFPNHVARSLVSGATRTIGLLMTDIMNPTLTLAARTIERELSRAGYGMMFAASDASVESEKRAIGLFLSYRVDGMLIYPASHNAYAHISAVADAGIPVLMLVELPGSGFDTVAIDDRAGAFKAVSHLCKAGHRHIAMLDGGKAHGNLDKMKGAQKAIRAARLPKGALSVFEPGGHSLADGSAIMAEVMATDPRPTALFASTDSLAIGALHWCRENGVSVPRDLAVIGYDNTEMAAYGASPLSTVNYAADEISRLGVDRILRRIAQREDAADPETTLIEPDLIIRGTT
ncbi:LacI family DNA-binding transcriptional regulator [Bauldia litoralis]|uniref:LacI family DNA-binding transcriptional regulator n=1 Tax=Bauldia litoralis TaxID=665467 RepID=UPI003264F230